jgi:predicted metalloprotease
MAYVVAHEYGHHIQNLLGINDEVTRGAAGGASEAEVERPVGAARSSRRTASPARGRRTAYADQRLEGGDLEEAIDCGSRRWATTPSRRQTTGRVNQESFTHGSSAQRKQWFTTGFESGDPSECDTFS